MKTLSMKNGTAYGRSGSMNYRSINVQLVHERIGIPYQVQSAYTLAVALSHSAYGIQVVEFSNGAICYGVINYQDDIPAYQTLQAIERMDGVKSAIYIPRERVGA